MLAEGKILRVRNWGEPRDAELENSLAQRFVPESAALVDGYHFGEVWRRADLNPRERMVCILAALMCRGHLSQLKRHVEYALDAGLDEKQICEVFAQAGWYRGWPCVRGRPGAGQRSLPSPARLTSRHGLHPSSSVLGEPPMDSAADLARKAANLHAFIDQYVPRAD